MIKSKSSNSIYTYKYVGILVSLPLYSLAILILGSTITAGLFVFHIVIVPLIFKYSKTFRRILIFANFVQWPYYLDWEDPSKCGIEGGRNITIRHQSKVDRCPVDIGIWHILPKTAYERMKGNFDKNIDKEQLHKLMDEELASSRHPIIMYCHGNSNNRATSHRILLYKFFQRMDFHTITFDYRGYGNSTDINPSEPGVVEDALLVYEWLVNTAHKHNNNPPVFIWGHSLGTGISSAMLGNLPTLSKEILDRDTLPLPNGLILEAPFCNLADEVDKIPITRMVTWLPYYDTAFIKPFREYPAHRFTTDVNLARVNNLPILILHAKDDVIVPFITGLKLYRSILQSRTEDDAPVKLHAFDKSEKLGHKYICRAKDLEDVIGDFVAKHQERQ